MPIQDSECLYGTIKNISGARQVFSFLPPHGRELDADEEFTTFGDPLQAIQSGINRVASRRNIEAFERAVQRGDLAIIRTPAPILESADHSLVKMLTLTNGGTLAPADPCWTHEVASESVDAA